MRAQDTGIYPSQEVVGRPHRRKSNRAVYISGDGGFSLPQDPHPLNCFILMPNTASPQAQLIYELGRGFGEKNLDIVAKTFHRDSRHIAYPRSLNIPEQSAQEYLDFVGERIRDWTDVEQVGRWIARVCFAAAKHPPQPNIEIVADIPGKVVAHVRISLNVLNYATSDHSTAHLIDLLQGQDCIRGFHHLRVDAHRTHRYRRRREPEDEEG